MRYRSDTNEIREQSSIFYFSSDRDAIPRALEEHNTHMFLEDVSLELLPTWLTRNGSKITVEITPANTDVEEKLSAALDATSQGFHHRDLGGALSEFLRLTATEVFLAGRAVFEIVYLRSEPNTPNESFELVKLNSRQIFRRWSRWYQYVPTHIAREQNVAKRIPLPSKNIAVFTLPGHLKRRVAKAMESLSATSTHRLHDLALKAHSGQLPYDFTTHERSMGLALAEAVREIGWTARGTFADKVTSYYSLRQNLRFKLFVLEVREALLAQLNLLLERIGTVLGWTAQLSVSGMTTRLVLEQALNQLASGKKPFIEIMDEIRAFEP